MIGQTNTGGGGKLFAAIGVIYPEGSTCICFNEETGKLLKAKSTIGQWIFRIPGPGTWTVSCTDGTESASKIVEITTEGQSVNVELVYDLRLYWYGDTCDDVTGGWESIAKHMNDKDGGATAPTVVYGESSVTVSQTGYKAGIYICKEKINLTGWSTLELNADITSNSGGVRLCVWTTLGTYYLDNRAATIDFSSASSGVHNLDVSGLDGSYYIGFGLYSSAAKVIMNSLVLKKEISQ